MRIVQYNAQVKDAPRMNPQKMAEDAVWLGANTVVLNVGGISAWYPTQVPFHHANEYTKPGQDFLREALDAFHSRNIRVVARFDFALAEDYIYYQNPQWFCRAPDGTPLTVGNNRPGLWRNLYVTCVNGGYQNEAVGLRVMEEVVERYDIDGIFFNGGYATPCWCEHCKRKYQARYGKPLPENPAEFEPDWLSSCNTETTEKYWRMVQSKAPELLFTRYYFPFELQADSVRRHRGDNINERSKTGNLLCTEAQDILSLGKNRLPAWGTPAIHIKMGRTVPGFAPPIGIIHMCPGMDWRHLGLPAAELRFWSSQVLAHGGQYWATVTGVEETNTDKRMLKALSEVNSMIQKAEADMSGTQTFADVLLFCDDGTYVLGWADALLHCHIEFDMAASYQFDAQRLKKYPLAILPKGFPYSPEIASSLEAYVQSGGRLIIEGTQGSALAPVQHLLGVEGEIVSSEEMKAAYLRVEEPGTALQKALGNTGLAPLGGRVGFCTPRDDAVVYATWVPPFAPPEVVGRPPERASLHTDRTQLPLCLVNRLGKGSVMFLPYEPSLLSATYAMEDFIALIGAYVEDMLAGSQRLVLHAPRDVMTSAHQKEGLLLVHFVNGIGQRPLKENIPCGEVGFTLRLEAGQQVLGVDSVIGGEPVDWRVENGVLEAKLPRLQVWDMLRVRLG